LAALGDAVYQAPYKAPPRAPVLYVKPRNTLSSSGSTLHLPAGWDALQTGATVGMVIGRCACRVRQEEALDFVAGFTIVNDASLPHDTFYRPSIRLKARDGFCPIGPTVTAASSVSSPDDLAIRVWIDGELAQSTSTGGRVRSAARLLADVTEFMTLQPGDVLMLGVSHGAPVARARQHVAIEVEGLGRLENPVIAEEVTQ
jgi:5-oxopent-3-ene-1,2,5-tricarboxylate decarboxylase/2-hydroxyhepta-2,4-diene-1,7-dioate isomerase